MPAPAKTRGALLARGALAGAVAGLGGVAAMTVVEKVEQAVTRRPDSYVPARTLLTLLGRHPSDADRPIGWNHAMHWGTGALVGALRGVWAVTGLRGPRMHLALTVVRLATDQTLENATGAGAPPPTWPLQEQLLDTAEKAVYSLVTGLLTDRLLSPALSSRRGARSH